MLDSEMKERKRERKRVSVANEMAGLDAGVHAVDSV
jgi:hypothetical protein